MTMQSPPTLGQLCLLGLSTAGVTSRVSTAWGFISRNLVAGPSIEALPTVIFV